MRKLAFVCVVAIALVGCMTSSKAQMTGIDTATVSISELSGDADTARKTALVQAAKLAHIHGYPYFEVLAFTNAREAVDSDARGPIGTTGPTGFVGLGQHRYNADLTVRFVHESDLPANRDGVYEVRAWLRS